MKIGVGKGFFTTVSWVLLFLVATAAYGQPMFDNSTMVFQKCGACHKPDPNGNLDVIQETRKTPEEWKNVVDRMIRINGAPLEDENFDAVIKELSRDLILTPDEMAGISYINSDENSQYREIPQNELEQQMFMACVRCHTWGKLASHRNTKSQWGEVRNLHLGYYPTIILQMRQMDWPVISKDLIDPLAARFAFDAPQWRQWLKNRKKEDLAGPWVVAGYQPGMGYYQGIYRFTADPSKGADEYVVEKEIRYESGAVLKTSGSATLFGDYHLRYALAPTPLSGRCEGVFDLNADTQVFTGKWWALIQDANTYGNEQFARVTGEGKILSVFPRSLRIAGENQTITIVGTGLPNDAAPGDIAFSDGQIKATAVLAVSPFSIVCRIEVGNDAKIGMTGLAIKGVPYDMPINVFNKIDGIRIDPALGRARVSCGAAYPPQGVQFVARGVSFGPDGKPDTGDDLILEPVDAKWRLEEQVTRENDDDLKYLQTSIENGLYTPITTYGPIEKRLMRKEGTGLIAVCASFLDGDRELNDRARLAVTVPDFVTHIK